MDKELKIIIDEEESILCEKYFYEYNGYKNLIEQFTVATDFGIDNEKYTILLNAYNESFALYQSLWTKLIEKYIDPKYRSEDYSVVLQFDSNCLVVSDSKTCSCCSN